MIDPHDLSTRTYALRQVFEAKLGVKSRTLAQALKRAGRRLPRKLRREGQVLLQAEKLVGNPKLARQMKPNDVDRALAAIGAHLEAIDVADRRKGRILGIAGVLVANLLIITAVFVWWLWDNGYVGVQGGIQ